MLIPPHSSLLCRSEAFLPLQAKGRTGCLQLYHRALWDRPADPLQVLNPLQMMTGNPHVATILGIGCQVHPYEAHFQCAKWSLYVGYIQFRCKRLLNCVFSAVYHVERHMLPGKTPQPCGNGLLSLSSLLSPCCPSRFLPLLRWAEQDILSALESKFWRSLENTSIAKDRENFLLVTCSCEQPVALLTWGKG